MSFVQYILALQFLTFVINVALGIFIFVGNPKRAVNRAFGLFSVLGVAGWNLSIFLTIVGFRSSLFWGRMAWPGVALMAAGLLWFVHIFPEPTKHAKVWRNIALVLGVFFAVLGGSPWMVTSVTVVNGYITGTLNPIPYLAFDFFFILALFYAMVRAWIRTVRAIGLARNQLFWVASGITAFLIPFLTTNILLPLLANDFRWNNLGPIFTIFLIIFVTRAIIRYRFLEIRWVVKRGFDFLLLWGFALAIIVGLNVFLDSTFQPLVAQTGEALILAIFFVPVSRYFSTATARLASRGSYYFKDAVSEVSALAHASLDIAKLERDLADRFETYFGFSSVAIIAVVPDDGMQASKTHVRGFKREILKSVPEALRLTKMVQSDVIEAEELKWILENGTDRNHATVNREILRFSQAWNIQSLIPFSVGDEIVGLAILGKKKNQSVFSEQDIALLRVMRGAVAPAMANAVRFSEINRLYTQLSELDRAKSDFINVVSHQFRTPLTSILWNSEMCLEQKSMSKREHEMMGDIYQSAEFLNTTLSGIVDMLEVDNNSIHFERRPVDLNRVVRSVIEKCDVRCKNVRVSFSDAHAPAIVSGDESRLTSIVSILMTNACTYAQPKGAVSVDIRRDEEKHVIHLTVTDDGIGISKKDLPHIYEKFFRGENALHSAPNGTGVGLYLVKKFVEKQRGTISVFSKLGKGTTFTVSFPEVTA